MEYIVVGVVAISLFVSVAALLITEERKYDKLAEIRVESE